MGGCLSSYSAVRDGLCAECHAHEIVHALTSYALGFNSTVFQMWVNPDAAEATPSQVAIIAVSGPLFSLVVGAACRLFYQRRFRERPSGLAFLMLAVVGIYSFLGPLAGTALGGDLHIAFTFLHISTALAYLASATGFIVLPCFVYYIGRELLRWVPHESGRAEAVVCTTLAPWLLGTFLLLLLYWPLPRFLIGSTIGGSAFWAFAVLGAATRAWHTPGPLNLKCRVTALRRRESVNTLRGDYSGRFTEIISLRMA